MDIERNSKASRLSSSNNPQDRNSLRSVMSLERLSSFRDSSLTRRVSLVNAMDLQSSMHSNRTGKEELLIDDDYKRFSNNRRSSVKSKEPYSFEPEMQQKDLNRKSQYKISHECSCSNEECLEDHCICYLTPREICVIGQCCPRCIALKNEYLKSTRGFQLQREKRQNQQKDEQSHLLQLIKQKNCKNLHYFKQVHANEACMKDLVFCTCKKSHCQKKYCLCFEKGVKCGKFCICLECENHDEEEDEFREEEQRRWERYATYTPYDQNQNQGNVPMDTDIQQYLENEEEPGEFSQTMQFEPVNFDNILSKFNQ